MDKDAFFWQTQDGRLPPPRAAVTLGIKIISVDAELGTIHVEFEGKPEFTNPAGQIQGGFLAAMLDDTMGPALAAMLKRDEFAPTLNLNVNFVAPAKPGRIEGLGRVIRKGKRACLLSAELTQDSTLIATANATALIQTLKT